MHWRPYVALALGLCAVSAAAIIARLAQDQGTPSLALGAARLCVATLVLTPVIIRQHEDEVRAVTRRDLTWAMIAGLALALHFAVWISSLEYTAVVNSVTLGTTTPLWVALLAPVVLHEKLPRGIVIGLALALGGGLLVSLSGEAGDPPTRHAPLLGNGLALSGAVMGACYLIIGRQLRARLGVLVYSWLVYGTAAIIMCCFVIVAGQPVLGLPGEAYLWMLVMGLVPQLIGHSSFNYALGYLPAAYIGLIILLEPIGSGALAIIFLDEWPVPIQLGGAVLILLGVGVASRAQTTGEMADYPDSGGTTTHMPDSASRRSANP